MIDLTLLQCFDCSLANQGGDMRFIAILSLIVSLGNVGWAATDCRDQIKDRITVINANSSQAVAPAIVNQFVEAYDLMPKEIHPFFCSFAQFTLIKQYVSSADSGMNFRLGLFEKNFDVSRWLTWKEQLSYGAANTDDFPVIAGLPSVEVTLQGKPVIFLYPLLVHEMAHNLSRSGDFQSRWDARHEKYASIVPEVQDFCFYWCAGQKLALVSQAEDLYSRMYTQTDWYNAYSRVSEEDFADSFAYYVLIQKGGEGSDYKTITPNGTAYSLRQLMGTPLYKEKMDLLAEAYATLPTDSKDAAPKRKEIFFVQ